MGIGGKNTILHCCIVTNSLSWIRGPVMSPEWTGQPLHCGVAKTCRHGMPNSAVTEVMTASVPFSFFFNNTTGFFVLNVVSLSKTWGLENAQSLGSLDHPVSVLHFSSGSRAYPANKIIKEKKYHQKHPGNLERMDRRGFYPQCSLD